MRHNVLWSTFYHYQYRLPLPFYCSSSTLLSPTFTFISSQNNIPDHFLSEQQPRSITSTTETQDSRVWNDSRQLEDRGQQLRHRKAECGTIVVNQRSRPAACISVVTWLQNPPAGCVLLGITSVITTSDSPSLVLNSSRVHPSSPLANSWFLYINRLSDVWIRFKWWGDEQGSTKYQ